MKLTRRIWFRKFKSPIHGYKTFITLLNKYLYDIYHYGYFLPTYNNDCSVGLPVHDINTDKTATKTS